MELTTTSRRGLRAAPAYETPKAQALEGFQPISVSGKRGLYRFTSKLCRLTQASAGNNDK